MKKTFRQIKRMIVAIVGFTLLLVGIAMLVLPGPAIVVIPVALAILATEFAWARRLLLRIKKGVGVKSGGNSKAGHSPETRDRDESRM